MCVALEAEISFIGSCVYSAARSCDECVIWIDM